MNTLTKTTAWQKVAKAIRDLSGASITAHEVKAWASVTFSGERHRLDLVFEGPDAVELADRFDAILPGHEFDFPDHLVVDASVNEHRQTDQRSEMKIELLLLEEQPQ